VLYSGSLAGDCQTMQGWKIVENLLTQTYKYTGSMEWEQKQLFKNARVLLDKDSCTQEIRMIQWKAFCSRS